MAPGQKNKGFNSVWAEALQQGFPVFGFDATLTVSKHINATTEGVNPIFQVLKPLFSKSDGGTKDNNSSICGHYKTQASEHMTCATKEGFGGKSLCVRIVGSSFCHLFPWTLTLPISQTPAEQGTLGCSQAQC